MSARRRRLHLEQAAGYTSRMDTVRFGRALGFGARSAAKTLVQAIDAAKAPAPNAPTRRAGVPSQAPAESAAARPSQTTASRPEDAAYDQPHGVLEGARRFRDSAVRPAVRLSGVLMLEVVGVFFALFALYGFNTMWRFRAGRHAGAPNHGEFVGGAVMLVVFGYFSLSSFLRARRRERRRR